MLVFFQLNFFNFFFLICFFYIYRSFVFLYIVAHCATDLSLESLTADTDELDSQDQKFLIPHQVQKSHYGSFSQDNNCNFIAPQHVNNTCDQVYDRPMGDASCNNHNSMATGLSPNEDHASHMNAVQSQNSPYSMTHRPTNHFSIQSGARAKGDSTSLFNSLHLQNSTSQGHINRFSEPPPGAKSKGLNDSNSSSSQSHNSESSRKQAHKNYYSVPSSRGGHRSALKEVALGGQVHGSFKRLDEDSKASVALNCVDIPPSHPKAESNHYVAPRELGLPRPTQVQRKPDAQGNNMVQDVRFTKLSGSQVRIYSSQIHGGTAYKPVIGWVKQLDFRAVGPRWIFSQNNSSDTWLDLQLFWYKHKNSKTTSHTY